MYFASSRAPRFLTDSSYSCRKFLRRSRRGGVELSPSALAKAKPFGLHNDFQLLVSFQDPVGITDITFFGIIFFLKAFVFKNLSDKFSIGLLAFLGIVAHGQIRWGLG